MEKMYTEKAKFLNQTLEDLRKKNQALIEQNLRDNESKNLKINELMKILEENFGVQPVDKKIEGLPIEQASSLEAKMREVEAVNSKLKEENLSLQAELEDLKSSIRAYRNAIHEKDFRIPEDMDKPSNKQAARASTVRSASSTSEDAAKGQTVKSSIL